MYSIKYQGSWLLFTVSRISLYRDSLYQSLGVPIFHLLPIIEDYQGKKFELNFCQFQKQQFDLGDSVLR